MDCGLAKEDLVAGAADMLVDDDELVWPRVEWRLVPMELAVCS